MKDIYQLAYISESTDSLNQESLIAILDKANSYNKAVKVTGVLVYNGGHFLQLLEGEQQTVRTLFEKIKRDSRHLSLREIFENYSDKRIFENWSMAFKNYEEYDISLREKIEDHIFHFNKSEDVWTPQQLISIIQLIRHAY